jgi:hypothetical protein
MMMLVITSFLLICKGMGKISVRGGKSDGTRKKNTSRKTGRATEIGR